MTDADRRFLLPVPPSVEPYVRVLGEDLAIEMFLRLGGARRVLSVAPRADNMVVKVVGLELARALYGEFGLEIPRVPVAKNWIARVWWERGVAVSEIARQLHVTDKTVRRWLKATPAAADRRAAAEAKRQRREELRARQIDLVDWLDGAAGDR